MQYWLQLEAIKAERGGRVEDGAVAPEKPLVEVLREAKEAKEAAFQAMWKTMKTGACHALVRSCACTAPLILRHAPVAFASAKDF